MSNSYNVFQQVFGISLASNLVGLCTGTQSDLQQRLAQALPKALSAVGPGWEVAWGPVIWKDDIDRNDPDTHQGNAWFVAKNDSVLFDDGTTHPAYVIAIAGTSGLYDWIVEDAPIFMVINIEEWATSSSLTTPPANHFRPIFNTDKPPLISSGFGHAVYQLVNNSPPEGSPGQSCTLPQFLQSIQVPTSPAAPAPKLVITGHSLGGALAPSLAYTLLKAKALGPFAQENVQVYPTAGPSPGNLAFCQDFSECFPSPAGQLTGYQHWNTNIVNRLDVVPCAYCTKPKYSPLVLSQIYKMFGNIPLPEAVKNAVAALGVVGKGVYVPLVASFFDSKFPIPPPQPTDWLTEAHKQHVDAYSWQILDMDTPSGVCEGTKQRDMAMRPVLSRVIAEKRKLEERDRMLAELEAER